MRRLAAALALLAIAGACEDHRSGGTGSNGAVQLVAGADVLPHSLAWVDEGLLYSIASDGPYDLWWHPLDDSGPELVASGISRWEVLSGEGPFAGWIATEAADAAGTLTLTIRPLHGSNSIVIDGVRTGSVSLHADECAMLRGAADAPVFWRGKCDALRPVPAGVTVFAYLYDRPGHWIVSAGVRGEMGLGLYDLGDDDRLTTVVPPLLDSPEMLPGGEEPEQPVSFSVGKSFVQHCWQGNCVLSYDRILSGSTIGFRRFAFHPGTGREVLLPLAPKGEPSSTYRTDERFITWGRRLESDQYAEARYGAWDLVTDEVVGCDVTWAEIVFERGLSGSGAVLFGGAQTGPWGVTLALPGGGPCVSIEQLAWYRADGELIEPVPSPDGKSLAWVSQALLPGTALWRAEISGRDPRKLLDTPDASIVLFLDRSDEVLVKHQVADGQSWSLIELGSDPPRERPLASGVFRSWDARELAQIGSRSLLMGTSFDTQDGTGELSIVDLDSGSRRVLDSEVSLWTSVGSAAAVYHVRGRYPSARDGLWARRLP